MIIALVDNIQLNFNAENMALLNIVIVLMMLGVAMEIKLDDFRQAFRSPKPLLIGLIAQFLFLPAFTFLLTMALPSSVAPSIALGLILVAACPGGNLSNIMTYLAKGNCAISVAMTVISSCASVIMTPFNLALWGRLNPVTAPILRKVTLDPMAVFLNISLIIALPMIVGSLIGRYYPAFAQKVRKPFKYLTLLIFISFVFGTLALNWQNFLKSIGLVMIVVLCHNALALNVGYWSAHFAGLVERDARAVCIEVGIQNSALGLLLVFNFFHGLGGMAVVVAWWGIWHIISGLTTATFFSRRTKGLLKNKFTLVEEEL